MSCTRFNTFEHIHIGSKNLGGGNAGITDIQVQSHSHFQIIQIKTFPVHADLKHLFLLTTPNMNASLQREQL